MKRERMGRIDHMQLVTPTEMTRSDWFMVGCAAVILALAPRLLEQGLQRHDSVWVSAEIFVISMQIFQIGRVAFKFMRSRKQP